MNPLNTSKLLHVRFAFLAGLLGLACNILAAPTAGPEFEVGPPVYVGAAYAQIASSAAFDGTNFVVVWRDNRDRVSWRAYGTRVTTDGTVLDRDGILLDPWAYTDLDQVVVCKFGSGLVLLMQYFDGYTIARRVGRDGRPADTNLFEMYGTFAKQPLAANGTNYLVTWSSNYNVFASRLCQDGTLLDTPGIPLVNISTNHQYGAAVTALGTNWLVTWTDLRQDSYGDIFGTLVTPDGTVVLPDGFPICTAIQAQRGARSATVGDTALIVWVDEPHTLSIDSALVGTRINALGQVLDPLGLVIDNYRKYQALGEVATDGTNWVVVGSEASDSSHCSTVAHTVQPQGSSFRTTLDYAAIQYSEPVVAFGATNYAVFWETPRGDQSWMHDIVGMRLPSVGATLDPAPFVVSLSASSQIEPAVAGDGTNYLLVWSDNRRGDGRWDISATRVTAKGVVREPGGIPITSLDTVQTNAAVAYGGGRYLVAWVDSRGTDFRGVQSIYAARVGADGHLFDTNGFLVTPATTWETKVAVGSVGTNFLVVWSGKTDTFSSRVACARVSGTGTLLDATPLVLSTGGTSAYQPRVSSNGTNYLITYAGTYCGRTSLSPEGTVLSTTYPSVGTTTLAGNGSGFLATADGPYGINGYLYDRLGVSVTNFTLATTFDNHDGYLVAIAGNGYDYLMVFNPSRISYPFYFTQITSGGRLVQTNLLGFTNATAPSQLALAGNTCDYLLAYWKPNSTAVPRVRARVLDAAPVLGSPDLVSGQVRLTVEGPAERLYEVQSSTNLLSWSVEGHQSNQLGSVHFSLPLRGSKAFYRALQLTR